MAGGPPTRVLLIGADAALWIGLSSTLGANTSQIFVPRDIEVESLTGASGDIDVIIVVVAGDSADRMHPLHLIAQARLQERTIVLAQPDDSQAASEAVLLGMAGFVERGTEPERLSAAVRQVSERGMVYDSSGASELQARLQMSRPPQQSTNIAAAKALASALELKDTYTGGHAERVTAMAMRLARAAMLEDALPSEGLEAGFLLHDVGKIGIPESILNKSGGLTDTERRVLQTHPILGERVVAPLGFPECVRQVIRHHHERWDGHGYPDGLAGRDIPAAARLFSIADVLDAMTSLRPYRRPVPFADALGEIRAHAGTQFDPELCDMIDEVFSDTSGDLNAPFSVP